MRKLVPLSVLLLASACGQADRNRDYSGPSEQKQSYEVRDVAEPPSAERTGAGSPPLAVAPGIAPTAAPGVAFNYRYAFRLPAARISAVQEQHAQACEKLGINRCRITGMRYRLVNQRDIEGMLAFKLDPAIARQFGKGGIDAVLGAEGMLVDSEISGVDAGAAIKNANRNETSLNEELRKIEERLRTSLNRYQSEQLEGEAARIRQSLRANRENRDEQEESLATTPMVFHYGSGDLAPGFDMRSPLRTALERSIGNVIDGMAFLLMVLITLLPWALIGGLGWWLLGKLRLRLPPRPAAAAPPAEVDQPAP